MYSSALNYFDTHRIVRTRMIAFNLAIVIYVNTENFVQYAKPHSRKLRYSVITRLANCMWRSMWRRKSDGNPTYLADSVSRSPRLRNKKSLRRPTSPYCHKILFLVYPLNTANTSAKYFHQLSGFRRIDGREISRPMNSPVRNAESKYEPVLD